MSTLRARMLRAVKVHEFCNNRGFRCDNSLTYGLVRHGVLAQALDRRHTVITNIVWNRNSRLARET